MRINSNHFRFEEHNINEQNQYFLESKEKYEKFSI